MENQKFPLIFRKIKIGEVELKNRTIFPPISTNFADEYGHLTEKFINHYVRRAKGGVALVIVENSCIDYPEAKKGAFQPAIDSYEFYDDWKNLTAEVHKHDCKISVELAHPGFSERNVDSLPVEKVEGIIEKYANSAEIAKNSGFDMVEIQAAHGLLVNQFLSPLTNHRKDKWGKLTAFAVAIREKIAEKCGENFPVSIRLAVDDLKVGGIDGKLGSEIAYELADAGYDMIQADIGLGPKEKRLEPMPYQEGWRAYLARRILPIDVPVTAVGMIRSPEIAENILENGVDLVALGRTLIADPDWVNKVRDGKIELIRKCIGCSECIKARHDEDVAIRCGVNPNVGNEEEITPTKSVKTVAVVGCGPAGLEAAEISAIRGHNVHLFCEKFGGQLNIASVPPGKDKLRWLIEYFKNSLSKFDNIKIHNGEFFKDDILDVKPDVIIIATGAEPLFPFTYIDGMTFSYDSVLQGEVQLEGKNLVVAGAGLVGCETANFLADKNKVTVVEMLSTIASGMETITRDYLLNELKQKDVKILTRTKVVDIEVGKVIVENTESGEQDEIICDAIVIAIGGKSYVPFEFDEIHHSLIGDAKSVGKIIDAIKEGYEVAKTI